jgi:hypothetical protein
MQSKLQEYIFYSAKPKAKKKKKIRNTAQKEHAQRQL